MNASSVDCVTDGDGSSTATAFLPAMTSVSDKWMLPALCVVLLRARLTTPGKSRGSEPSSTRGGIDDPPSSEPRNARPGVAEAPPCENTMDDERPTTEEGCGGASREPTLAVLNMLRSFAENEGLSLAACAGNKGKLDWWYGPWGFIGFDMEGLVRIEADGDTAKGV
jgi:hypothetical protein